MPLKSWATQPALAGQCGEISDQVDDIKLRNMAWIPLFSVVRDFEPLVF